MMSASAKTDLDKELFDACQSHKRSTVHKLLKKGANPKNLERRIPGEFSVSPLHLAAGHGWEDIVQVFIEKYKCDPMFKDGGLQTPLHYACKNGHVDIIRYLKKYPLVSSSGINIPDNAGDTPLHKACESEHLNCVQYLLFHTPFCNPNISNNAGLTPIQVTPPESIDIIREVFRKGANVNVVDKVGNTLLHHACESCNLKLISFLLEEGKCNPNIINKAGLTPIQVTSLKSSDVMSVLIQHGADPNVVDNDGNTLLHKVLKYVDSLSFNPLRVDNAHCLRSAKCLLEEGKCDPNIKNKFEQTPIQLTSPGTIDITRELVQHGADPKVVDKEGNTLLHLACKSKTSDPIHVKFLLEEVKCDPNIKNKAGQTPIQVMSPTESIGIMRELVQHGANTNTVDEDGNTSLLHQACKFCDLKLVNFLLAEGKCDPNISNKAGLTPIQLTSPGSSGIIRKLIQHGANPNVVDNDGNTPLHKACESCNLESLKFLFEMEGCDPNIKNKAGLTPIHVTSPRYSYIIRELVQHGANPNAIDADGNTPLHKACDYGNFAKLSVKILLEEVKCDPNIKNIAGLTPIQVASPESRDIMKELIQHGANTNVVDNDGNTLLHQACKTSDLKHVKFLLEEGKCDPNIRNKTGLTPIPEATSPKLSGIIRELIKHGANPNVVDKDGNTLLHQACKICDLKCVKFILGKAKCHPNIQNNAGLTPIQVTSPESSDIIRELVQHGANPNIVDNDGNTPLHKACENTNNYLESVKFLLEDGKCDPNIKNKAGLTPIQVTSPNFPDIIRELIRHGASSTDAYQTFGNVLKNPKPLQPPVKVFIVGNPSTGKSTLTESLKSESSQLLGRFVQVSGVDAKTAGINPHEFHSKKYGSVTFYDFAGQRAYYSSHAAVLRNSIQTSPIFIVVIDLLDSNEVLKKDMLFWLSFLSNQICSLENKPHVIVVGGHADAVSSRGEQAEQKMSRVIESLPPISDFILVEYLSLDCRYARSSGMSKLRRCLRQSCDALRVHHKINFNAHCFFIYLLDNFGKLIAVTVKEITAKIKSNSAVEKRELMAFIPATLQSLCAILDELNDRGHILYLKDHSNNKNSWVIIDKAALLSEVTGTIFAPADFKQHCTLASSAGVVPLSNLSHHFPKHNIKMLVAFLYHLEFCREITDPEARALIVEHHQSAANSLTELSATELYFLFPGLIRLEAPENIWEPNSQFSHYFGWTLKTESGQFFTTRLLQVLILRLAFSFALAADPKDVKSDVPAFQRKCSIWKNGIFWGDRFGVETLVEMLPSNDAIMLLMRSYDTNLTNFLFLRSKLIPNLLGISHELCNRVHTVELFIDPSECNQYPLTLANCNTPSVQEIAKAVIEETSHPAVVSSTGKTLLLKNLLIYEPYAGLGQTFLTDFFRDSSAERIISDESLLIIANHIPCSHGHEIVKRLFKVNHSQQSDDFFISLKNWRDKCKATYQNFKEILDQMSIFTGRNLLKLAGVESDIGIHYIGPQEPVEDTELQPKQDTHLPAGGVSLDFMSVKTALTDLLQWHELGLHLGIRKIKLDEIRLDFDKYGQSRQKSEMIDLWLHTDKDASWKKLRAALEQMGEFTIADEIRKQYISCMC